MKFGSLFAGIGGLDLGLERAGMECAWQVEIDDYCQRVLAKHWPEVPKYRDVRECGADNLEAVDLICGGFPCQPHSLAGKRKGKADDRNLWPEYRRIVAELRPRWVLGENVPGIITTMLDEVLSDLEGEGYATATVVVPACAVDAPHRRDRVFVIAYAPAERRGRREDDKGQAQAERDGAATCGNCDKYPRLVKIAGTDWPLYVAHSERTGLEKREASWIRGSLSAVERQDMEGRGEGFWLPEPDVGRMADGVPARIHGGRVDDYEMGSKEKSAAGIANSRRTMLRNLWEHGTTPASSSKLQQSGWLRDTVPGMPCEGRSARRAQATEETEGLQGMRTAILAEPQQEPQYVWKDMPVGDRAVQCGETLAWPAEPEGVPRVASGVPNRVNRLRALGNAVVPQVAEWIGRRILEFDSSKGE